MGSLKNKKYCFVDKFLTLEETKGDTVIWPAEWTHTHKSQISKTHEKYIATGWFSLIPDKNNGSS